MKHMHELRKENIWLEIKSASVICVVKRDILPGNALMTGKILMLFMIELV